MLQNRGRGKELLKLFLCSPDLLGRFPFLRIQLSSPNGRQKTRPRAHLHTGSLQTATGAYPWRCGCPSVMDLSICVRHLETADSALGPAVPTVEGDTQNPPIGGVERPKSSPLNSRQLVHRPQFVGRCYPWHSEQSIVDRVVTGVWAGRRGADGSLKERAGSGRLFA